MEDSDEDEEQIDNDIQSLNFVQKLNGELKESNLWILSKTVTGNMERSDSMESVIEDIVANTSGQNNIENVLSLNDRTLEFYDRNKNIDFWSAIADKYVKFSRIVYIFLVIFGLYYSIVFAVLWTLVGPYIQESDETTWDYLLDSIFPFSILFLSIASLIISFSNFYKRNLSLLIHVYFSIIYFIALVHKINLKNDKMELLSIVICAHFILNKYWVYSTLYIVAATSILMMILILS